MTATTTQPSDPVRIYVLWHAAFGDGRRLARAVYHWFRGRPDDLNEAGYGIPVRYRSETGGQSPGELRPIETDESRITIVVPLVDEHMVLDPVWRRYLRGLARHSCHLFPVALHAAAYNLPAAYAGLNFIRVDRPGDPRDWSPDARLAARRQRLLSLLTQACCRLLQACQHGRSTRGAIDGRGDDAGLPIEVFLSHAKADGVAIANALRDRLLHHGQLQVFFDESDLPFGYGYGARLEAAAGDTHDAGGAHRDTDATAAMIAVYTDAYAGRPWCQRELHLARRPARIDGPDGRRWSSKPLLIVDALQERRTRYLAEVGHAPVIRWNPDRGGEIIDLLLREVLWTLYYRFWSHGLALPGGAHAFAGALDLHGAMQIRSQAAGPVDRFYVPPPGPALADRRWYARLLPEVGLRTFDDLERETP